MSIKSKRQKALALALAISLNLSVFSPVVHAFGPIDPTPTEGKTPNIEQPTTPPDDAGDEKTTGTEDTTIWNPENSKRCDIDVACDLASIAAGKGQEWKDIVSMLAILFGGHTGQDQLDATAPTAGITDNTTLPELPEEFTTINPAGAPDPSFSDTPTGPDLSGIQLGILGGIPLGPNASYTWTRTGPGAIKVQALVYPLNPEVDSATKFGAIVTSTNPSVHVYPPAQYASETYTNGGDKFKIFKFMTMEYANGHPPRFGSVSVKVNAKVYEGTTSLCSDDDSSCDNGLEAGSEFDSNGNLITNNGNSTSNTGSADLSGLNGIGTNTGDLFGNNGNYSNSGNNSGTGETLDNLFNSDGTSNGNSPDWLTDGFTSNNADSVSVPTGFGSQFGTEGSNSSVMDGGINGVNGTSGDGGGYYVDGTGSASGNGSDAAGYSSGNGNNSSTEGTSSDSALGGIFSKIDSAIGNDPAAPNSLTNKFSNLVKKTTSTAEILAGMTPAKRLPGTVEDSFTAASNAELENIAKQMLATYGTSQEDIKNGKLYDTGSAYTDPQDAWNLNRMDTILKNKNIKAK